MKNCGTNRVTGITDIISGVYPNDVYLVKTDEAEVLIPALKRTISLLNMDTKKAKI